MVAKLAFPYRDLEEERLKKKEKVRRLHLQGFSQRQIARKVGLSQARVCQILKEAADPGSTSRRDPDQRQILSITLQPHEALAIVTASGFTIPEAYIAVCKGCGMLFFARRRGQVYCCNLCAAGKGCDCKQKGNTLVVRPGTKCNETRFS